MMNRIHALMIVSLIGAPSIANAQDAPGDKGIRFEEGLSWEQVKEKAKAENRYIFVDANTTWCQPCRVMEDQVYVVEEVGAYFNGRFISVKIQFDRTPQDGEQVREWYPTAEALLQEYAVQSFPTYLFLSPEGQLVYKAGGLKRIDEFLALARDAVNPSRQYPTLLASYKEGRLPIDELPGLARNARQLGDQNTAEAIATEYKETLQKLSDEALLTQEHLRFISEFVSQFLLPEGANGKFFSLFYKHPDRVDSLLEQQGRSRSVVDYIIHKEEIDDTLWQGDKPVTKEPDWERIKTAIDSKYGAGYAERLVPPAQLSFYMRIKNWPKYTELVDERIRKSPPTAEEKGMDTDAWLLNVYAWNVFEGSDDKRLLGRALRWIELAIELDEIAASRDNISVNEQILDTKANLLYKVGRVEEAIALEEEAVAVSQQRKLENDPTADQIGGNLAKMRRGEPTWPVE